MSSVSVFDEKQTILEINKIRKNYFWNQTILEKGQKRIFQLEAKISIYAHHMVWIFTLLLFISLTFTPFLPRFLYGANWPNWAIIIMKYLFYMFFWTGYYIGNSHEAFYAHIILHGYFQMNIMIAYLRQEFRKYKNMSVNTKVYSYRYQKAIEKVLLHIIKQHQQLTE